MAITLTRPGSRAHAEGMPENRPDPEVPAKAQRRRHSAAYKLEILEEADRATEPGEVAALLRREGLYSSHLAAWRKQRREGTLAGLAQKRGRKGKDARDNRIEELERDNARLTKKLDQAETIIEVQKKLSRLLGIEQTTDEDTES
ncbi:MAG: transposase [Actinomycetota bacterium]